MRITVPAQAHAVISIIAGNPGFRQPNPVCCQELSRNVTAPNIWTEGLGVNRPLLVCIAPDHRNLVPAWPGHHIAVGRLVGRIGGRPLHGSAQIGRLRQEIIIAEVDGRFGRSVAQVQPNVICGKIVGRLDLGIIIHHRRRGIHGVSRGGLAVTGIGFQS